jgi:2-iminobutanoate/2-iminopropanoate deaminase
MTPRFVEHDPPRRYAKACVYGNFIFLAGEDSKDPRTQEVRGSTVGEQTEYLFQNMKATLENLGSSLANVIKLTVYLKDPRERVSFQEVRAKYIPQSPPSTLVMSVDLAEPDMLVEVEALAVIPEKK